MTVTASRPPDPTDLAPSADPSPSGGTGGRKRRKSGPQPFDFRRPSKFSRDHARALQIVHETFARQFTTILSTTLRSVSQVTVSSVDHVSYDEYVRSSPELAFLAILNIDPLPGAGILQLPLDIAMAAIDRLLGGTGQGGQPSRALTDIESSLLRELVQRVLRELDYSFESLVKTSTSIVQLESNPQFAQVAAASDMVVVATYDVRIGHKDSTASLCIPFTALQPVLEQVSGNALFADRKGVDPEESEPRGRRAAHRRAGRRRRPLRRRDAHLDRDPRPAAR